MRGVELSARSEYTAVLHEGWASPNSRSRVMLESNVDGRKRVRVQGEEQYPLLPSRDVQILSGPESDSIPKISSDPHGAST